MGNPHAPRTSVRHPNCDLQHCVVAHSHYGEGYVQYVDPASGRGTVYWQHRPGPVDVAATALAQCQILKLRYEVKQHD